MVTGVVPHVGGPCLPGSNVKILIGGLPAVRMADMVTCVGPPDMIAKGAPTILIGGMPAARMGDSTAHGGVIALGHVTVLLG
jgi:uncharacterized Zn-binding protein involved in type VI secretion